MLLVAAAAELAVLAELAEEAAELAALVSLGGSGIRWRNGSGRHKQNRCKSWELAVEEQEELVELELQKLLRWLG